MYRYHGGGNANTLWVDSTDSYFKRGGQIVFGQQLFEHRRFLQAQHILSNIPESLLGYDSATGSFGCPDCTDGCGIYLEFGQSGKVRKFTIDYQTGQLTGDIKKFAELIKTAIDTIERH